jgi:hypothetical protein
MFGLTKRSMSVVSALLMIAFAAGAQTQQRKEALSVQGNSGPVTVLQSQGRLFVDVQELAKIIGGSVSFEKDRIVLTLPRRAGTESTGDGADASRFSPTFTNAAIGAMASIREWGGMLMIIVQDGYPVGNNMAGNTLAAYQARSADAVALASTAASTDADFRGLELLKGEFSNVQEWSDRFVQARISLSAAKLSTSENAIKNDEDAQKAIQCGQFLAQMFASGAVQENTGCR